MGALEWFAHFFAIQFTNQQPGITILCVFDERKWNTKAKIVAVKCNFLRHSWVQYSSLRFLAEIDGPCRCCRCCALKDIRANCFCASFLRTQIRIPLPASSARAKYLKWTMIGQMAIALALLGFNDLTCSVTNTFLFRNRFYLQLFPHCPKNEQKINAES